MSIKAYEKAKDRARAAKKAEEDAFWRLPREHQDREYRIKRSRVLSGTTTVEVDYEIDRDDLESLGYHHSDDCHADCAPTDAEDHDDDRRSLDDWHQQAHSNILWAMCREEPCRSLSDDFRSIR